MVKLFREFNGLDTERRLLLVVKESDCPGLPRFLASQPYGTESPLVRAIVSEWYLLHSTNGTLSAAVEVALDGPGGLSKSNRNSRQARTRRNSADLLPEPDGKGGPPSTGDVSTPLSRPAGPPPEAPALTVTIPIAPPQTPDDPNPEVVRPGMSQGQLDDLRAFVSLPP